MHRTFSSTSYSVILINTLHKCLCSAIIHFCVFSTIESIAIIGAGELGETVRSELEASIFGRELAS